MQHIESIRLKNFRAFQDVRLRGLCVAAGQPHATVRTVSPHLDLGRNRSNSFRVLLRSLSDLASA